jgi:hypothetical protein
VAAFGQAVTRQKLLNRPSQFRTASHSPSSLAYEKGAKLGRGCVNSLKVQHQAEDLLWFDFPLDRDFHVNRRFPCPVLPKLLHPRRHPARLDG